MTLKPARTRWRIIERSNSAKPPGLTRSTAAADHADLNRICAVGDD